MVCQGPAFEGEVVLRDQAQAVAGFDEAAPVFDEERKGWRTERAEHETPPETRNGIPG
jgi:hypothetical protein